MKRIIPIEKAFRSATPGPFVHIYGAGTCFHDGNLNSIQIFEGTEDEPTGETIAEIWPTVPAGRAKLDTALLVHCFNHMPKAIEVLRDLIAAADRIELEDTDLGDLEKSEYREVLNTACEFLGNAEKVGIP